MPNNSQTSDQESAYLKKIVQTLDGLELKTLIDAGLNWLRTNQQTVNSLNVFPVPDGDTGTNMLLTMQSAYNEIINSDECNVGKTAKSVAQGALMGARGNSGVILSQLWRGFARALDNLEVLDSKILVAGLNEAKNTAYKGVVRPVEGTILTVAKDVAAAVEQEAMVCQDLVILLEKAVKAAEVSVAHTPELLPILKQAGVVDSGGKGLFYILDGMLRFVKGLSLESSESLVQPINEMNLQDSIEAAEPGQDYEIVIDFRPKMGFNLQEFYAALSEIGTSIQVGEGDGMYRMHIHTTEENKSAPIDYTESVGIITKVAMENLIAQMEERQSKLPEKIKLNQVSSSQIAVIAISPGIGISRIFASLGVNGLVEGGQTMNPSTEEILESFENLASQNIIILPNNKNIILAAQSAASMTSKKVVVIGSTSIPQGLSALLRLDPDGDLDTVAKNMTDALSDVETGEITTATRSVEIDGVKVNQGEVIALHNGKLTGSYKNIGDACLDLLKHAQTIDKERITLYCGDNVTDKEVEDILQLIRAAYPTPMFEVEVHAGNQPHYQFIISVE